MTDFSKYFEKYMDLGTFTKGVDFSKLIELNTQTLAALQEAGTIWAEGGKKLAERQAEIARTNIQATTETAKELATIKGVEAYIAKQSDLLKQSFEQAVENTRELAEMAGKTSTEAGEVLTKQMLANVDALTKAAKTASKTASTPKPEATSSKK